MNPTASQAHPGRIADIAVESSLVLIVEDDSLLRMHAAEVIEEAGFHTLEAHNADEAIRLLEKRSDIHFLFTDIDMPGSMNGLKLAHTVARRWPIIHIVATSGQFNMRDGDLPAGGLFIAKPYRADHLISTLQQMTRESAI